MHGRSGPVDIGVLGATGTIGRAVAAESADRGHRVTAFTRSAARIPEESGGVVWKVADLTDVDGVAEAIAGVDVVVNAISAGDTIADQIANADVLPATARTLLKALERHPSTRLVVVGGGGSLEVEPGRRLVDNEEEFAKVLVDVLAVPPEYRKVVLAHAEVLDMCRLSNRYWTYLSPSAGRIESGVRTARYRTGGDQLLPPPDRAGDLSAEDLAVALVDEIEIPRHIQRRFAVGH
jgi:putative NADH-flavin reductase